MNLVHRKKCELGQSRKQELIGRLQPKQGCQSDNLSKEIVSRQAIKSCLEQNYGFRLLEFSFSVSTLITFKTIQSFNYSSRTEFYNGPQAPVQSPGKSDNHKHYKVFFWGDLEMTRILRSSSLIEITDNKLLFETIQFSHDTQTAR